MQTNTELGNLREDFGELKGTVAGIKRTVERLEYKMDEAKCARSRLEISINEVKSQIDTQVGVKVETKKFLGHVWTGMYTIIAALLASGITFLSTSAHPHP